MRILYATDGSPGSVAVADLLSRLALSPDDTIRLLAVDPPAGEQEAVFEKARKALSSSAAALETETRSGPEEEQILQAVRERPADLVALGAMGRTGLAHFLMGSVAERVMRHAEVPVLVARPVRYGLKRALVAVDRSEVAKRVAEAAAHFPLPPETELCLTTVLPPQEAISSVAPMVWAALAGEMESIIKASVEAAEERLRSLAHSLQNTGRRVTAELHRGDPASSLIAAVENEKTDLVIMGSHGEGGVDRFLLGSVSERVARHAHCSVLVVR
jgi:nucleotide-binding universal stress UspA family protein